MTPGDAVGWIVVVGFALTLIITLLALIKLLPMDGKYLGCLFSLLLVELIGAAFWLFYKDDPTDPPQFIPGLSEQQYYLFDSDGTPVGKTKLVQGETTLFEFNNQAVAFNVDRGFEVQNGQLLLTGLQNNFQLGTINLEDLTRDYEDSLLSFETHLNLGLHYAECVAGSDCSERRDATRAIPHLFASLGDETQSDNHERAVVQLFHLKQRLGCQDFMNLADEIEKHRPVPNRYKELGDVYFAMALNIPELFTDARLLALKQFFLFLSMPQVNSDSVLFNQAYDDAKRLAEFLDWNDSSFPSAIDDQARPQFSQAANNIEVALACPA